MHTLDVQHEYFTWAICCSIHRIFHKNGPTTYQANPSQRNEEKQNIDLRISFYFLFLLVAHTHTHGGNFSTKNTIIFRNALFGKQNKHAIGVAIGSALNTEKFTSEQFVALLIYS